MSSAPIGVLGGTFDPIHNGHLRLAQEALEQCGLAAVRIIPAGIPPHRNEPHADMQHRLEMARLAIQDNAAFMLDEREIHRSGTSYTVDTLNSLRGEFGSEQPLCLLMGGDAFLQLDTWHEWKQLFELAHIVVMQRNGRPLGNLIEQAGAELREAYRTRLAPTPGALHEVPAGRIAVIDMPALEISATGIRGRCAQGRSLRYLVPDAVAGYIQSHHLYTQAC